MPEFHGVQRSGTPALKQVDFGSAVTIFADLNKIPIQNQSGLRWLAKANALWSCLENGRYVAVVVDGTMKTHG